MSRKFKKKKKKIFIMPDKKYNSLLVSRFINLIMVNGKKSKSEKIVYNSLDLIKINYLVNPLKVFNNSLKLSTPTLELKRKKVGGSYYNIPVRIFKKKGIYIAMKWIKVSSRLRKEKKFFFGLFKEIIDTCNENSNTIRLRDELYKNAELNRAFTHFVF